MEGSLRENIFNTLTASEILITICFPEILLLTNNITLRPMFAAREDRFMFTTVFVVSRNQNKGTGKN